MLLLLLMRLALAIHEVRPGSVDQTRGLFLALDREVLNLGRIRHLYPVRCLSRLKPISLIRVRGKLPEFPFDWLIQLSLRLPFLFLRHRSFCPRRCVTTIERVGRQLIIDGLRRNGLLEDRGDIQNLICLYSNLTRL